MIPETAPSPRNETCDARPSDGGTGGGWDARCDGIVWASYGVAIMHHIIFLCHARFFRG